MKRLMAVILAAAMTLTGFTACKNREPQPEVPSPPVLPGTLVGVAYAAGGGMMAQTEFSIRLNRKEIERTEFWPEDTHEDETRVGEHIPITEEQWTDVEAVILELYREGLMEACEPVPKQERGPSDVFVLDGGDYTNLSLIWETEKGTEEVSYYWPSDRRVITLTELLKELADPQGREITRYEAPRPDEIYFTRKHRLHTEKDFSFQLHYAAYDEEDPHWELIYYLGKNGAAGNGRIRLAQSDWDAFAAYAEELQLEYFPEKTKADDRFRCTLYYTDDGYKSIALNQETEDLLTAWFMELLQQKQN